MGERRLREPSPRVCVLIVEGCTLPVAAHADIHVHIAARRSELANSSGQGRRLIASEVQTLKRSQLHNIHECLWEFANGNSRVAISAGKLVSWLPLMYNTVSEVSCPISSGTLVSLLLLRFNSLSAVSCPISADTLVSWLPPRDNPCSEVSRPTSTGKVVNRLPQSHNSFSGRELPDLRRQARQLIVAEVQAH